MMFVIVLVVGLVVMIFLFLLGFMSIFFYGVEEFKSSPFECGFQPFSFSGSAFSMPFFVISLMFLLFDVEIIIMSFPPFMNGNFVMSFWFVVVLVLTVTCYEWVSGILKWISNFL